MWESYSHWDPDQQQREMDVKEEWGLNKQEVMEMLKQAGFKKIKVSRFGFMGLNQMFIGQK